MSAKIINGKEIAENILIDLRQKVLDLNRTPGLAVVLIGDDEASKLYVRNKKNACIKVGINFYDYLCGDTCFKNITQNQILEMIDYLNKDKDVDGIIVQLPIPQKFDTNLIINRIDPKKDVDGFTKINKEKFLKNKPGIVSPLMQAITEAIKSTGENLEKKEAVIISNNEAYSLTRKKDLENLGLNTKIIKPVAGMEKEIIKADVLVVIAGKAGLIKKEMIKPGAIVIDVGTNLTKDNTWIGDVEKEAEQTAGFITPVPGGIGPLTVCMLLKNVYEAAEDKLE